MGVAVSMRIDWRTLPVAALMTTPLRGNVISCGDRDGGMDRPTHPGKEDKPIGASAGGTRISLCIHAIWPCIPTSVTTKT